LRASRRRLALAGADDRRRIERALHEGVQQDLVALAVNLQLLGALVDSDPAGAKRLVDELARDVRRSLDETAQLALRIHPPLLEPGGLGAALRAVAVSVGASIDVAGDDDLPPELLHAIYFCGVEALTRVGPEGHVTIAVEGLAIDIATEPHVDLDDLRDRVEALGGLTVAT
jgi:signal transduction histidine kinase